MIIKYLKDSNRCALSEGTELKLGRVTLKIIKLRGQSEEGPQATPVQFPSLTGTCRICMADEFTDEDPLISPCACAGSLKAVHLRCLQRWVESRKIQGDGTFYWKSIDCEICKTKYPLTIRSQQLSLIHI